MLLNVDARERVELLELRADDEPLPGPQASPAQPLSGDGNGADFWERPLGSNSE
jgi:hypothetical protein